MPEAQKTEPVMHPFNHIVQVADDLADDAKQDIENLKTKAIDFWNHLESLGVSREISVAKSRLQEGVMWAAEHIKNAAAAVEKTV